MLLAASLAGILVIAPVDSTHAALVAPGGGAAVLAGTTNFGGTVVGDKTVAFAEPSSFFTGTLRSVVVQNGAGLLDFYFQIANTSAPALDDDIFRLALTNFNGFGTGAGDSLQVDFVTNGLTGIAGAGAFSIGTKPAYSGDRLPDVPSDQVGFDFDPSGFLGGPGNVDAGETSQFVVIRTNARLFQNVAEEIVSGNGTAFASGFAPVAVPEPGTALAGLIAFGACAATRRRRHAQA